MANIAARELPAMGILPLTLVVLLPALITFITSTPVSIKLQILPRPADFEIEERISR